MKEVKRIYAKDFVQPLVEDLAKNGEEKIYFNPFISAVLACKFVYPRIVENTKKEDIVSELDKMAYLDEIKFGRDGNQTFFEYTGNGETESMEDLVSKETFSGFSKAVKAGLESEQSL